MVRRYEIPVAAVAMAVALTAMACRGGESPPQGGQAAPGPERTPKTSALETGADVIQDKAPVEHISMSLDSYGETWHTRMAGMHGRQPDPEADIR